MIETQDELFEKCEKFLRRASTRWSTDITEQEDALEIAGGKYWNEKNKKKWGVYDKNSPEGSIIPVLSYNNISAQVNSIASPFSKSAFHINILNKTESQGLQDKITAFEGSNIAKNVYNRAFTRAVTCAAGYVVIGTKLNGMNIVPNLEFCSNQSMVAFDPDCITPDGSDAMEGALVSYISINKARHDFGEDVIPDDFPKSQPRLSFSNMKCWNDLVDKVQLVKYFVKDKLTNPETGEKRDIVCMYTLCGDKIISAHEDGSLNPVIMPISIIPIVRFAGYNDYDSNYGQVYTGFVQKMMPNIEMMSLAMTLQATRMRRCSNVRYMGPADAINGCENYFRDFEKGSAMGLFWNPKSNGVQLVNDTFQTGDIAAVMNETRNTMQDMSGFSLQGTQAIDRTATEVMQQQINSESNVQELYLNAEAACNTIAKIVLAIMNNGVVPPFTLEGGPNVITTRMKERAEIQAIQTMVPPEQQMLLAIRMANTIDSDVGKELVQDLKANCGLQLSEGKDVGGMMNICEQMKKTLDETMEKLEATVQENNDLQYQLQQMEMQLNNQKTQQKIDLLKWQAEMKANEAQMSIDNAEAAKKLQQEDDKLRLQAVDMKIKADNANIKAMQTLNSEQMKKRIEELKLNNLKAKGEFDLAKMDKQLQLEQVKQASNVLKFNDWSKV